MCGIAGIISINSSKITNDRLTRMGKSIAHRGPDGEHIWINTKGNVGFSFRRLAIIDLSARGDQPMHFQDRYTIVYNGEVYNYVELKKDLEKEGYTFSSESDTEVILAMYDKYRYDCVKYFDGMFAFAIWDEVDQTLFAARDRFGEKPFFYHWDQSDNTLYFASEMKALWAAGVQRKVNDKMLLLFISLGYTQNPSNAASTFFENIQQLPSHSYLIYKFSSGKVSVSSYWDIDLNKRSALNEKASIEKFTHLFSQSIKRRLRSDVQVGTSLSGGLDSSSIVATICKLITKGNSKNLSTFSAVFDGYEKDESKYMQLVIQKFDIKNLQVKPGVDALISDLEKLSYHQEEPFPSSSTYAQFKVFELASRHGIKVLLDGQGADETLAGYTKYYHWYWQEALRTKGITAAASERKHYNFTTEPWGYKNYLAAYFPGLAASVLKRKYLKIQHHQPDISRDYYNENFDKQFLVKPDVRNLNDILYFNVFTLGLEELLRIADRNSMAFGTEVRLPFLSHELIEFVFSLPSSYKIQQGFTKYILRKSMEVILPEQIVWRRDKIGYEPPQKIWMQDQKLIDFIYEAKMKLVNKGILKASSLQNPVNAVDAYDAYNFDWRYLSAGQIL